MKNEMSREAPKPRRPFRLLPWGMIDRTLRAFDKLSLALVRLHVSPDVLTVLALVSGAAVGIFYYLEKPVWAVVFIFICGAFDILDGKVAEQAGKKSLFGAIFDSTLDRYSESFIYFGLALHFRNHWGLWVVFFAFLGSTMVSYTRARAEGLGIECRVGILQRAERLILVLAGTLIGIIFKIYDPALIAVLALIALVANITALQRVFHVRRIEQQNRKPKEN